MLLLCYCLTNQQPEFDGIDKMAEDEENGGREERIKQLVRIALTTCFGLLNTKHTQPQIVK